MGRQVAAFYVEEAAETQSILCLTRPQRPLAGSAGGSIMPCPRTAA